MPISDYGIIKALCLSILLTAVFPAAADPFCIQQLTKVEKELNDLSPFVKTVKAGTKTVEFHSKNLKLSPKLMNAIAEYTAHILSRFEEFSVFEVPSEVVLHLEWNKHGNSSSMLHSIYLHLANGVRSFDESSPDSRPVDEIFGPIEKLTLIHELTHTVFGLTVLRDTQFIASGRQDDFLKYMKHMATFAPFQHYPGQEFGIVSESINARGQVLMTDAELSLYEAKGPFEEVIADWTPGFIDVNLSAASGQFLREQGHSFENQCVLAGWSESEVHRISLPTRRWLSENVFPKLQTKEDQKRFLITYYRSYLARMQELKNNPSSIQKNPEEWNRDFIQELKQQFAL